MFNEAEQFPTQTPEVESMPEVEQESKEHPPIDDHEHIVDIESPEIKMAIREAKRDFNTFFKRHEYHFDLERPDAIEKVLEAAEKDKIFEKAQKIRELIFDKNISVYGVCYLSNKCDQNCKYCPMGQAGYSNWEKRLSIEHFEKMREDLIKHNEESEELTRQGVLRKETLESIQKETAGLTKTFDTLKTEKIKELEESKKQFKCLSPEETSQDVDALRKVGHQEICLLASEELWHGEGKAVSSTQDPDEVIKYTQIALDKPGVKEVILNMVSYSRNTFKYVLDGLKKPEGVGLQHRVFQETYDREAYEKYHSRSPEGGKIDFNKRYNSQIEALKAGFDEVGIGALFGLSERPLSEIKQLQIHAREIKEKGGKEPKRCCLPLANVPEGSELEIDYKIPGMANAEKITELIYALARLAMPTLRWTALSRQKY